MLLGMFRAYPMNSCCFQIDGASWISKPFEYLAILPWYFQHDGSTNDVSSQGVSISRFRIETKLEVHLPRLSLSLLSSSLCL